MADTYSARAGYSEHQTGLVVDVTRAYDDLIILKILMNITGC